MRLSLPSNPTRAKIKVAAHPPVMRAVPACVPRALVLLCGSPRQNGFWRDIGRSPLALPVDEHRTILDTWREQAAGLAVGCKVDRMEMRVLIDRAMPAPAEGEPHGRVEVRIDRDVNDVRGTGGVLRDFAEAAGFGDHEWILVAGGSQIFTQPVSAALETLAGTGADVALLSHSDGTPSGLMLVRCECLRTIPQVGFCDFKEQGLRAIGAKHEIAISYCDPTPSLPVRTAGTYIVALRRRHRLVRGESAGASPFAEDWEPTFKLVEEGAEVHSSACIHDSVVLAGARVEADAVVVRSVVGPRGMVRRGHAAVDTLLSGRTGRADKGGGKP